MSESIESINSYLLPVVPLRSICAYPSMPLSLEIGRKRSLTAIEEAQNGEGKVFLIPQLSPDIERPFPKDLFRVGVVAKVKSVNKSKDDSARVLFECTERAEISTVIHKRGYLAASGLAKTITVDADIHVEALLEQMKKTFAELAKLLPNVPDEVKFAIDTITDPGLIADFLASNLLARMENKLKILAEFNPLRRLELLVLAMNEEMELLKVELSIHQKVRDNLDQNQRDYYLREQLGVIRDELGMNDDDEDFEPIIRKAKLPQEVEEKLLRENAHLQKTPFGSAEATVLRNYIEVCLELPWNKYSSGKKTVEQARKILDRDHEGIPDVKTRILEYLAVRELTEKPASQILCLAGPPGVGKTSVARSIAEALGRKYVRVALGGVRDEADIRGHRKTYVGAMPGRIIDAVRQAGVANPLILLDEIDKLANDNRGDPSSALLEVLDAEQNKYFRDHFVELPFDLSQCVFLATANDESQIPAPLYDRMEIIEMKSYTYGERVAIAKNHLIPKQLKLHGLTARQLKIDDDALLAVIRSYTREAGVRNLERKIAGVCRKCASGIVEGKYKKLEVTPANLAELLGPEKLIPEHIPEEDTVGLVNGMAYTESGGSLLPIEVALLPGTGKIELTGSLGDVMKESAHIAVSFVRSRAEVLGIDPDFYKNKDIHIHAPEGAIPKDGPSAGIAMTVALVSALTHRPVRRSFSITGEVSLLGRAYAIGGLKEKTMAALRAGVSDVILPKDNARDIAELPEEVKEGIVFHPVTCADEALALALLPALPQTVLKNSAEPQKKAAPGADMPHIPETRRVPALEKCDESR